MKKVLIIATFQGKNKSLGYVKDMPYQLIFRQYGGLNYFGEPCSPIVITRLDKTGECHYSHIGTFLNNWTNIKQIKKS